MNIAQAHDALVGRSLGEFVLREQIGEGGFGMVYRAVQPALDREAVVKVLHGRLHTSKLATERFLREAKFASKLDHPYAAHIYAFGAESDGQVWIAMELVRGTPLDQLLRIQGPLPLERFVPLLERICEVVHTAHEQGIIHRDLKPANVMVLARAGRLLPKLLDFGIAKGLAGPRSNDLATGETVLDLSDSVVNVSAQTLEVPVDPGVDGPALTQHGAIMGSPPYMAPEQWADAGDVDARTDLYALGILAYELLTGKPPFQGRTMSAIADAHATQEPPPLGPRFPVALDAVFAKVLAKKSADRYPDALAFVQAFRQAAAIGAEVHLPAIDPAQRDAALNRAPQPIAEAIAGFEAARNAHQARDALVLLARTITRYLGLLALACRSRISGADDPLGVSEALRALHRRSLTDREWLELTRQLTRVWIERRDAYPIPELVDAFGDDHRVFEHLDALIALRDAEAPTEGAMVLVLEAAVGRISGLLDALVFLSDYSLVVMIAGGVAERWMGVRRTRRTTTAVRGKGLAAGVPALLDKDGAPVLSLAPLFQVAAPTPGAPLDLFLFDGRDRSGAKLVALPSGFEHHDDEFWGWFRTQLAGSFDETEAATAEEKPPYLGLSSFSAEDGAIFVGREKLVDAFANRLRMQPLLAVVGRSGAGKSSFVQAGVIPALPAGWRALTMRPGPSPLGSLIARLEHAGVLVNEESDLASVSGVRHSLYRALEQDRNALGGLLRANAAERGPVLLVIDQLEEMFTLCHDVDERRVFAESLAAAARAIEDPVRVVFTLRDDFLVRTEQVPALRNRIGQGLQLLTVPVAEDLLRILIEPARRSGYEFEDPELPKEMVKEVAEQPGALALISFTAAKLWELRDRHFKQLTRMAYKSLGGVGGALARHAELTLDAMPSEERALTREAFRHLVTTQNTRAVLTRNELRQLLGDSDLADAVLEKLVAARLLVASENEAGTETIEIVHEALLIAWPRLVEWRQEDIDGARFREQLRSAASQWKERGRPQGLLWRGDALADYTRWRARHPGPLVDDELAFADASLADAVRGRRNRGVLVASAFATLVAVVVGLIIFNARVAGQRARAETAAGELHANLQRQYEDQGRRLVLAGDPLQALAYLAKASDLGAAGRAHQFLVAQAVRASDGELFEVRHDNALFDARFSPDGTRMVTAGLDREARIWNAQTGELQLTLHHMNTVANASFAPDQASVLTGSYDGTAVVWNATTGAAMVHLAHDGPVRCALFAPDGKLVVTASEDDSVALWELPAGSQRFRIRGDGAGFKACAFSADGSMIAAGDSRGMTWIWDARTGKLVHELRGQHDRIRTVEFAPDNRRLVTASNDGTTAVWDVSTGQQQRTLAHRGPVWSAKFSPDQHSIVTASSDRLAAVWDADTGERRLTLSGHAAGLEDATYSPDGKYIVTASEDASVWLWDAETGNVVGRWRGHQDVVGKVNFDPAGHRVISAGDDGTAIVWSVQPQERITWLVGHQGPLSGGGSFSSDGHRVVTASLDGTARIWDPDSGHEIGVIRGRFEDVALSPDGRSLVTGGEDGTVEIWDLATGASHAFPGKSAGIRSVAWSADGASVVAGAQDGWIRCWEAATGRLRFENHGHDGYTIYTAAFDATGQRVITVGADLTTRIWDLDGKQQREFRDADTPNAALLDPSATRVLSTVSRQRAKIWDATTGKQQIELVGHVGQITSINWSPDGTMVLTAAVDDTARLWDATTGDILAIFSHPGTRLANFSPDGTRVLIGGNDGSVAMHELARYTGTPRDFERLLKCRAPFEVQGDHLQARNRDRRGCNQP